MGRTKTESQKAADSEYQRSYRIKNAATLREKKAVYYAGRKEYFKGVMARYRVENLDKLRAYDKARRAADPEKKKALDRAYHARTKEQSKVKRAFYWAANALRKKTYDEKYRVVNKDRLKSRQLAYYEDNKPAYIARVVRRNAQKLKAMPGWANEFFIEEAYRLAALRTKMLGYSWHVDHIVPLQSKLVCGLHVHNNLQVIPGAENLSKGNRRWPDMP